MTRAIEAKAPGAVRGHISRLDVARAAAFLAVYFFHFTGSFERTRVPWAGNFRDYSLWPREAFFLVPVIYGWLGVTLFFVLSGFCIHFATLSRKGAFSARDFFWRRFLRLYPAYFVALVVLACLAPWVPSRYFNGWQVVAHVFLVHNLIHSTFFGINLSFWSLAVEVQFYLLYPLLLYMVARWGMSRSLVIALILNLVCATFFALTNRPQVPVGSDWSFPLVTWCDWILGAALAEAYVEGRPLFPRAKTWLAISALVLVVAVQWKPLNVQSYLFGSVFFVVLLQIYLDWKSPLTVIERALIPVGIISYSLYLWHQPLIYVVDKWGAAWKATATPAGHIAWDLGVTTLLLAPLAAISHRLFEVQVPRLIQRFMTRQHLPAPPLPGPAVTAEFPPQT